MTTETLHKIMGSYGFHLVQHCNDKTLLDHSVNVGNFLKTWGEKEAVVMAGYFHSVYGRENTSFAPISSSRRDELRSQIGAEAEEIVYVNCAMTADSFWSNFHHGLPSSSYIMDRFARTKREVSVSDLKAILRINFANMIDHIDQRKDLSLFKWGEFSLYIQYHNFLSESERQVLTSTFGLDRAS